MTKKFRRQLSKQSPLEVRVVQQPAPESSRTVASDWARIVASIAQVLTFVVVAGGYFYTVLPLFQFQLLQEQSAELELAVRQKESRLKVVEKSLNEADERRRAVIEALEAEKANSSRLQNTVQDLTMRERRLAAQISESERTLEKTQENLEKTLWRQFISDLKIESQAGGTTAPRLSLSNPNDWSVDLDHLGEYESRDPHSVLTGALEKLEASGTENPYPKKFFENSRSFIAANRAQLACRYLDGNSLSMQYGQELQNLDVEVVTALNNKIASLTDEAHAKNHEIEITDDFRMEYSDAIRNNLLYDLYSKFDAMIWSVEYECRGHVTSVIDALSRQL